MKKSLLIVAALVAPMMAQAGITVSVRSDYVNTFKFDNAAGTEVNGTSRFIPNHARIDATGKVGEADVKAGFNLRDTGNGAMDWDTFTHYLYLSKTLAEGWTFTAGKLETPNGGFERLADDSGDSYLTSLANGGGEGLGFMLGNATSNIVSSLGNTSGFGVAYTMGDHNIGLQAVNEQDAGDAGNNDRRHTYGLAYSGMFGDWAAKAAYYAGFTDAAAASSNQTYMNVGVSGKVDAFGITLDYINNDSEDKATEVKDATNSIVGLFSYDAGTYKPQLKIESSKHKEDDDDSVAGSFERMAYALALEIKPSDDAFRYHVAYIMGSDEPGVAGAEKVDWSQAIVGIKYTGDLLK